MQFSETLTGPGLQSDAHISCWMMLVGFVIILFTSVLVYGNDLCNRHRLRHIPGPPPTWLGGNLGQLNVPFDSHIAINKWAKQYGPLFKIFVGHTPVIIVTDADLVKQIGTRSFMKFHNRPQPIMRFHHGCQTEFEESGMLFARDKFWAGTRATCEPLFHSCMLKAHAPLINKAASGLVQRLSLLRKNGSVKINDAMAEMTMEVIGEAAFGALESGMKGIVTCRVDFGAQQEKKSPIVQHAQSLFQPPNSSGFAAMRFLMFAFPFVVPVMYRLFIWLGAKRIQEVMQAKGYILGTSQRLLNNARKASAAALSSGNSSSGSNSGSEDEHDIAEASCIEHPSPSTAPTVKARAEGKSVGHSPGRHHLSCTSAPASLSSAALDDGSNTVPIHPGAAADVQPDNLPQSGAAISRSDFYQPTCTADEQASSSSAGSASASSSASRSACSSASSDEHVSCTETTPSKSRWVPSWYPLTKAANSSTGQDSLPQPWWRVDSWLTAPAELQFQRGREEGGAAYKGQAPEDHSLLYSLMNARRKDDGQPLSDLHICAQAFTFVLAGYETTSTAIAYALYELARNQAVQQNLQAEVDAFGRERQPSFDDLSSFPYAAAVFQEGMRLHPPVTPFIALIRETSEETELSGYKLPAGTKVGINVLGMHHDPQAFPDPEEFRPERFLDGPAGPSSRHQYAYVPFGVGPRKCIGHKFAMEEGIMTLVKLLQRFTFSLDSVKHGGQRLLHNCLITYVPRDGIWLNVEPRNITV